MAQRKLEVVIAGDSKRLGAALKAAGGKLDGFGSRAKNAGKLAAVGIGAVAVGAAAVGAKAFQLADDFDASMRKITGLVGLPKEEVDKLRGSVLELSGATAKSPQELADALFSVTSAGFGGQEALEVLELAARAAAGGLGDTQTVALAVGSAVNAFGAENLSAAEATDILVGTVKAGNLSAEELSGALGKILPIASAAGVGLDQVGASVALITRSGATASEAVTQMKAAIQAMNAPTVRASAILEKAGVSADELRSTLANDGLVAAMQMMETAADGDASVMRQMFGSSEALSGALTILNGDADTVTGVFDELSNATGLTDKAFASAADGAGFKMAQAMTKLKAAGVTLGSALLPLVATIAEKLSPHLDKLGPAIETHVIPALRAFGRFIEERVIPILRDIATFIRTEVVPRIISFARTVRDDVIPPVVAFATRMIDVLIPAFKSIGEWVGKAIEWFKSFRGAFTGEDGSGGGLAGVAHTIGEKIKEIGPVITAKLGELAVLAVEKLAVLAGRFVEWVGPMIPPLLVELGKLLTDLLIWIGTTAVPKIIEQVHKWNVAFVQWIAPMIPKVIEALGLALVELGTYIVVEGGKAIRAAARAAWGEIRTGFEEAWPIVSAWLADLANKTARAVGSVGSALWEKGKSIVAGLWDGVVEAWKAVAGWFADRGNQIGRAIGALGSALWGKGFDVISGFVDGYFHLWKSVASWFGSLGQKIVDAVGELGGKLYQKGRDLVQGFINGITSLLPSIPSLPGLGSIGGALGSGASSVGGAARSVGSFLGFSSGGPIPGPRGAPLPILAHGGEFMLSANVVDRIKKGQRTDTLSPAHLSPTSTSNRRLASRSSSTVNLNFYGVTAEKLPDVVVGALAQYERDRGSIPITAARIKV